MNIKLEINSFDHEGRGIGKYNNKVVFVPNAIPGEIVEIEIIKDFIINVVDALLSILVLMTKRK